MSEPRNDPRGSASVTVTLSAGRTAEVRPPRIPPKPVIGRYRRRILAAEWLTRLHQASSPDRVEELAPFVGRFQPNSALGRIADHLVAHRQLPTRAAVEQGYLLRAATHELDRAKRRPLLDLHRDTLLTFIDQHWAVHARGPRWRSIADHLGVSQRELEGILRDLAHEGTVAYSLAPGSIHTLPERPVQ